LQDGETLLWRAFRSGHSEVVTQLLAVPGIDVNFVDKVNCPGALAAGLVSMAAGLRLSLEDLFKVLLV
jgi:hypothetical protein